MLLRLDAKELKDLMEKFYILTKIRIVVFDNEYNEILAYPEEHSTFCSLMHGNEQTRALCLKSNAFSFEQCKRNNRLMVYQCHAGLVEATAPLMDNGTIIGYIMFGQITNIKDKKNLIENIRDKCLGYSYKGSTLEHAIGDIKYVDDEQILAVAKILEACTYYVLSKKLVSLKKENLLQKINKYIDSHLDHEITADVICRHLNISRTKLYETTQQCLGMGIARYVKNKRILRAKELLSSTNYTVTDIACKVGFGDYNYFCRVFNKETGSSPKKYRNIYANNE